MNLKSILLFMVVATSQMLPYSVTDLLKKKAPAVGGPFKKLDLSGKGLDTLQGLETIKNISRARIITLADNKFASISAGALSVAENVTVLNLAGNKLTGEGLKGIGGLKNLEALVLNSNNISDIPSEVLDTLPKLTFVALYDNPISDEKIAALKKRGLYVSTLPITRANLKKAGVTIVSLIGLILAGVAAYTVSKKGAASQGGRPQGEMPAGEASPVGVAIKTGNWDMVEPLVRGEAINSKEGFGFTPLMVAIQYNRTPIADNLLQVSGINIEQTDSYGNTALMWAISRGNIEVMRALIEKGAKLNPADLSIVYFTPLMQAIADQFLNRDTNLSEDTKLQMVNLLIDSGANVNAVEPLAAVGGGRTALNLAAQAGYSRILDRLLKVEGVDVNNQDFWGNTPLIMVTKDRSIDSEVQFHMVKLLLDAKADPNIPNNDGDTPLMMAAQYDGLPIVDLLIEKDANVNAINKAGRTASQLAAEQSRHKIVARLKEEEEKPLL